MCGYSEHIFKGRGRCMSSLPWYKLRIVGFYGPGLFKDGYQCVRNMDHSSWIVKTVCRHQCWQKTGSLSLIEIDEDYNRYSIEPLNHPKV